MSRFFLLFIFIFFSLSKLADAQKRKIDSSVYDKWAIVNDIRVNNDGRYVVYFVNNRQKKERSLVLQSSDAKWRFELKNVGNFAFCSNNTQAFIGLPGDSLALLTLGTKSVEYFTHIRSFNLIKNGADEYLTAELTDWHSRWIIHSMKNNTDRFIDDVSSIETGQNGINILVKTEALVNDTIQYTFKWINLSSDTTYTVWKGAVADNFMFNKAGNELAFKVGGEIWLFRSATNSSSLIVDKQLIIKIDSGCELGRLNRFSNDGGRLFFFLKEKKLVRPPPSEYVPVTVWNYKDSKLQSLQEKELQSNTYVAVLSIESHIVKQLQFKNEPNWLSTLSSIEHDDMALIDHRNGDFDVAEEYWNSASKGVEYLVLIKTGERIPITKLDGSVKHGFILSPSEKFVIFYDRSKRNLFSYQIQKRTIRNITKNVSADWESDGSEYPREALVNNSVCAWVAGERYVILHDVYDLWLIDLLGITSPRNITNGYGKKHHIVFRLLNDNSSSIVVDSSKLILTAFNKLTKDNGFYSKILNTQGDPDLLTMGPYVYFAPGNIPNVQGIAPFKARDSNLYIVRRMSCSEAPNYFSTKDFKSFIALTDVRPEREYNWMTSELFKWKTFDGRFFQGVLYKPEDFDSTKKYPLIFYYYEGKSDMKNVYIAPEASDGALNIPQYVSNGYLVATPDIHYTIGETGESAVNAVVSAAKSLSRKPWVDDRKMGIQGLSFGGYQTNYIVTHSHLFSAACSASGVSDLVCNYGALEWTGHSLQEFYEVGQFRMGKELWNDQHGYLKNSPLFGAKNVTTPLLMMHTTNDGIFPFANILEFYTLLRRLSKRAWLLQYDDANHSLHGKSAIDFTIRMQQFFDHFLKDYPQPEWMSKGIPARLKGFDDGLKMEGMSGLNK